MSSEALREEFEEPLKLIVTGRGLEVTPAIKEHIIERLAKIEGITPHVIEAHIILEIQKNAHRCHINYAFSHFRVRAEADSSDLYNSIERALEKLKHKLMKWKSKIQEHNHKGIQSIDVPLNVYKARRKDVDEINMQIEEETSEKMAQLLEPHHIVKKKKRALKTLTMLEAVMKMELSGDHFMVFKGEEDQKLKVLYTRRDQTYGLLEIQ